MLGNAPPSKYTSVPGWETVQEEEKLIELARQYVRVDGRNTLDCRGGNIVELGVEYGRSTCQFIYAFEEFSGVRIYSVDIFPPDHPFAKQHGGLLNVWQSNVLEFGKLNATRISKPQPAQHIFPALNSHQSAMGKLERAEWRFIKNEGVHFCEFMDYDIVAYQGKSYEVADLFAERKEQIDLLFVDAAHDYLSVKSDIAAWVNFVKPGGIVVFHDYYKNEQSHPVHIEVKKAVDEWQWEADQKWERHDAPDSLIYFVKPNDAHVEKVVIADGTLPTGASYSEITGVPGWLTEQEEKKLIEIARLFVPEHGVIVELGGGLGRSAAAFGIASKNKQNVTITTVDLFDEGSFSQRLPFNQGEAWEKNIKDAMHNAAIEYSFYPSKTGVVFFHLQQNSQLVSDYAGVIDLLFIDADHDYESVIADIKAWSPYVKQGGLMVFHDYHRGEYKNVFHGVVAAVNEWREIYKADWLELDAPGSLAVFKRQTANEHTTAVESSTGTGEPKAEKTKKTRKPRATKTT